MDCNAGEKKETFSEAAVSEAASLSSVGSRRPNSRRSAAQRSRKVMANLAKLQSAAEERGEEWRPTIPWTEARSQKSQALAQAIASSAGDDTVAARISPIIPRPSARSIRDEIHDIMNEEAKKVGTDYCELCQKHNAWNHTTGKDHKWHAEVHATDSYYCGMVSGWRPSNTGATLTFAIASGG
jgi:hypothetical protein